MTDRKTNDRFRNRFRKPRDVKTGRYTALEIDARDAEENPNSEEEEPDLTAASGREMDELALVVEELEDKVGVQDVEDVREFSESMHEGLATIRERHTQSCGRKRGIEVTSFPRQPLHMQLSVRDTHPWAALAADKGKQELEEHLFIRRSS